MQLRRLSERGDTIVEVLIAIAVAGAVIGGAYSLVNANTRNNLASQERSAAIKIAESQLEMLRVAGSLPGAGSKFCLYTSASGEVLTETITEPLPSTTNAGYPANCTINYGAATDRYVAGVTAGSNNTYTVYVNWDSPNETRAQVSMGYKVY